MEDISTPRSERLKISISRDGPYIVIGGIPLIAQKIITDKEGMPLSWETTRKFPDRLRYSLCRCGKSKNRPFCDNSHVAIHFSGDETASKQSFTDQSKKITGPSLILNDAKAFCAYVGFCDRAGGTWKLVSQSKDPAAMKIAIEETSNCPSGRLVISNNQGEVIEPTYEPSIALVESADGEFKGVIWVRGGIPIESANGKRYEIRNRVTLCGCGRSNNKPFCNGAHYK